LKIFRIKDKNGLYSNGKIFTKNGKMYTTEGSLTNSIVQSKDPFKYMGLGIFIVTIENGIEKEKPIEPWMYEKLNKYYSGQDYNTEIGDKLKQLNTIAQEKIKDGYEISDWE
jgi:hypothetical protein